MKYSTQTVREGEYLGPVDWSYDFKSHNWGDGKGGTNPDVIARAMETLKTLEENPGKYRATNYGGYPRCGWGEVVRVGMYDGWPFWRPVPSVLVDKWDGFSWYWFGSITDIALIIVDAQAKGEK